MIVTILAIIALVCGVAGILYDGRLSGVGVILLAIAFLIS